MNSPDILIDVIDDNETMLTHVTNLAKKSEGNSNQLANDLQKWLNSLIVSLGQQIESQTEFSESEMVCYQLMLSLLEDTISRVNLLQAARYYIYITKGDESDDPKEDPITDSVIVT